MKIKVTTIAVILFIVWVGGFWTAVLTNMHDCPPHTVQNVQRACNAEGANLVVDGVPGTKTIEAWVPLSQNWTEREIAKKVREND
jgi:hypothetical protein